jgi:hypothetical protein
MKKLLRASAETLLPARAFQKLAAMRSRRWQMGMLAREGLLDQVKWYIEEHGTVVRSGPFAGLIYPLDSAVTRWSLPKLLGSYESEIHPFLELVRKRTYDCVIDVGSAEGYYACGLARMLQVPVYAYDPEPIEKAFAARMAERNGLAHLVTMADLFTIEDMRRFSSRRALVVCDCEGFEEVLFRPDTVGLTRRWDLMIELHGTADAILPKLNWPHATTLVDAPEKTGAQDEHRKLPQRYLLCDSGALSPS